MAIAPLLSRHTALMLPVVEDWAALSDDDLTSVMAELGAARRSLESTAVDAAREVARRSSRDRGHSGLAARNGLNSPEKLIQRLTGVSFAEAKNLTGASVAESADWLAPVADALRDGSLTAAGAAAIAKGLGEPTESVTAEELHGAAVGLVEIATQTTPEEIAKAARYSRDLLDVDGIADREAHRRSLRSLKYWVRPDGCTQAVIILDPESAATVIPQIETLVSPRRVPTFVRERPLGGSPGAPSASARGVSGAADGAVSGAGDLGPNGVGVGAADHSEPGTVALAGDDRTIEQKNVDALVEIFSLAGRAAGSDADPKKIYGDNTPGVRVLLTKTDLEKGVGPAVIEGQTAIVSVATAERIICNSGAIPILFDKFRPIDVGKLNRLHSTKQRMAMAALWGGCPWTECTRPPSMTEAHHAEAWNGCNTTLINGVPFCRFHHMLLHNNGWRVDVHDNGTYWLIPPVSHDPNQKPLPLLPKNPLLARL